MVEIKTVRNKNSYICYTEKQKKKSQVARKIKPNAQQRFGAIGVLGEL